MPDTAEATLEELFAAQRAAQRREGPPSLAVRIDRLDRAIGWLVDHERAIVEALEEDFGRRSPVLTRMGEVAVVINAYAYARDHLATWMAPEERAPNPPLEQFGARARIDYQPLGVIGILAPWNTPLRLVFQPLCGVLAAGNRAMVKPSELTPATAALLAETLPTAFAPEEVAVVRGGADVAAAFSALAFDHLVFTGSATIARSVMAAAAANLTPVTLELGGKCPVIIGQGAAPELTATRIASGKLTNAGQACIAPDYLLVPEDELDDWAHGLRDAFAAQAPTLLDNPDYTAVINAANVERLRGLVDDARSRGAEIIEVNPSDEDLRGTTTVAPTLILRPDRDALVMSEEIFGPLLPLVPYRTLDDAIVTVNAAQRPLALYFFGTDPGEQEQVLARTSSGGVTVGDVMAHTLQEDLPFGGVGSSGTGHYRGIHGFKRFSHARSVFTQTDADLVGMIGLRPPFDDRAEVYLASQIKRPDVVVAAEPNPLLLRLGELTAADGEWTIMARGWTGTMRIAIGAAGVDCVIVDGRIAEIGAAGGPLDARPGVVGYGAPEEVWAEMLKPLPRPPFSDAFSAQLEGAELSGHPETSRQYYPAVRRVVELLRAEHGR